MPRRLVVLLCVLGATLMVAVVLASGGPSERSPLPEAGSAYGARPQKDAKDAGLLDALAPLLSAAPRTRGTARRARVTIRSRAPQLALPLDQAAAQLFLVGFEGEYAGSAFFERLRVRAWGGVVLDSVNYVEPGQLAALAGEVVAVARQAGWPAPLIAARQPGGEGTAFANLPPRAQQKARTPGDARQQARLAGTQLASVGIRLTLAPAADLAYAGGPYGGSGYGDDPLAVARAVRAAVEGYRASGVAAVPGHFPGEGAASQDPARGAATVGLGVDELRARDMVPFAEVARRAVAVQMSTALYAGFDGVTPATLLPDAVRELRKLGFRGVVVSGDLASATLATGGEVGAEAVEALKAGCDLLWLPGDAADQERAWRAVVRAVRTGELPAARVREALRRVAALKRRFAA